MRHAGRSWPVSIPARAARSSHHASIRSNRTVAEEVARSQVSTASTNSSTARARTCATARCASSTPRDMGCPTADVEVDVDMESYDDATYLWGANVTLNQPIDGVRAGYRAFVEWGELTPDAEARNFAAFWSWLSDLREPVRRQGRTFRRLLLLGPGRGRRDEPRRRDPAIDGGPTIDDLSRFANRPRRRGSTSTTSPRTDSDRGSPGSQAAGRAAGFQWRDVNPSGEASMLWYEVATRGDSPSGARVAPTHPRLQRRRLSRDQGAARLAQRPGEDRWRTATTPCRFSARSLALVGDPRYAQTRARGHVQVQRPPLGRPVEHVALAGLRGASGRRSQLSRRSDASRPASGCSSAPSGCAGCSRRARPVERARRGATLRARWRATLVRHFTCPQPERERGRGDLALAIEQAAEAPDARPARDERRHGRCSASRALLGRRLVGACSSRWRCSRSPPRSISARDDAARRWPWSTNADAPCWRAVNSNCCTTRPNCAPSARSSTAPTRSPPSRTPNTPSRCARSASRWSRRSSPSS